MLTRWQVNQGLTGNYRDILNTYWQQQVTKLETDEHDYKLHQLPLARIKKVMKADPEVKMISAEAPILFAKGCDIFITELTMRAWIHAEENKRRTLQRSDIASALSKSDMFDFLIDIVPREEAHPHKRSGAQGTAAVQSSAAQVPPGGMPQQVHAQHQMPPRTTVWGSTCNNKRTSVNQTCTQAPSKPIQVPTDSNTCLIKEYTADIPCSSR